MSANKAWLAVPFTSKVLDKVEVRNLCRPVKSFNT